jgi:hypothetical protein
MTMSQTGVTGLSEMANHGMTGALSEEIIMQYMMMRHSCQSS